jgi:hypothetical protein
VRLLSARIVYLGSTLLCTIRENRLCEQYKDRLRFFPNYRNSTIILSLWKHDFMNKKFEGHSSNWENCSYQCSGHQRSPLKSKNWRQCGSSFFPPEALAAWIEHQQHWKHQHKVKTRGVSHCGLAIYIFKYLKAKEKIWKVKYFTMKKNHLQKIIKKKQKSFKILELYNLKFQHKRKYRLSKILI